MLHEIWILKQIYQNLITRDFFGIVCLELF